MQENRSGWATDPVILKKCPTPFSKQSTNSVWLRRLFRRWDFSQRVSLGSLKPFEYGQFTPSRVKSTDLQSKTISYSLALQRNISLFFYSFPHSQIAVILLISISWVHIVFEKVLDSAL
jgi:hypothetical protein